MAFLKMDRVTLAWIYLVSLLWVLWIFACPLPLIILREFSVCFHLLHSPHGTADCHSSFVLSAEYKRSMTICCPMWRRRKQTENSPRMMSSKESLKGNRIKISHPGPMKQGWKWQNCFFKVPLCQLTNFNFLDTGEVEFSNFNAQSD